MSRCRMLKQATITPTQTQARQDALVPELRSRLEKTSTYRWERAGLGLLRVGRVRYRYASGFFFACGRAREGARLGASEVGGCNHGHF
jgi:hypothetical protein